MSLLEVTGLDREQFTTAVGGVSLTDLNVTVDNRVKTLSFFNLGTDNIYVGYDTANVNSYCLVPYAGLVINLRARRANQLRFFVAAGDAGDMNIQQERD